MSAHHSRNDPAPHPSAAPGARERIVRAATDEFAHRGYDGARIDAIARAAEVNKALVYYYFASKEELYRRLVIEHMEAAAAALERAAAVTDEPAQALRGIVAALFELLGQRPEISEFLLREVLNAWGHLKDEDFPILFRTTRPIAGVVERGATRGVFRPVPPVFVHFLIIASLNFFVVSRAARARGARALELSAIDPDPEQFAGFVADLVTRGLAASPGGPESDLTPGEPT